MAALGGKRRELTPPKESRSEWAVQIHKSEQTVNSSRIIGDTICPRTHTGILHSPACLRALLPLRCPSPRQPGGGLYKESTQVPQKGRLLHADLRVLDR